jgi:hypothetical protein
MAAIEQGDRFRIQGFIPDSNQGKRRRFSTKFVSQKATMRLAAFCKRQT